MKRLKDQEKASDDFSKRIIIDAEAVMDEADDMMKRAEERQRKYAERYMKKIIEELQQLFLKKVMKQNDLDARLAR